jgi:hypothetical protein
MVTAAAIFLAVSFACLLWIVWLAWRAPTHVGPRRSQVPDVPVRGSRVDMEA